MKRTLYRVLLAYKKNTVTKLLQVSVYLLVFVMLMASFFVSNISLVVEDYLSDSLDLHVVVGSSLNNLGNEVKWEYEGSKDKYVELLNEYIDSIVRIGETSNCYYDFSITPSNYEPIELIDNQITYLVNNDDFVNDMNFLSQMEYNFDQYKEYLLLDFASYDELYDYCEKRSDVNLKDLFKEGALVKYYCHNGAYWNMKTVCDSDFWDLKFNDIKITSGRSFNDEELKNEKNVCILKDGAFLVTFDGTSYTKKKINIGDKIALRYNLAGWGIGKYEYKEMVYEVIGLYQNEKVEENTEIKNNIYIPFSSWQQTWNQSYKYIKNNNLNYFYQFEVSNAYYKANNLKQLNQLMNIINEEKTATMSYAASTGDNAKLLGVISAVSSNLKDISITVFALNLLFLTIYLFLEKNTFKKEYMLLLDLGEKRSVLLLQGFIDSLIKIIVVLPLAWLLSNCVSLVIIEKLLFKNISIIEQLGRSGLTGQQTGIMILFIGCLLVINALTQIVVINNIEKRENV